MFIVFCLWKKNESNGKSTQTIWLSEDKQNVQIIDQTKLPFEFKVVTLNCFEDAFKAIKNMLVRGAPLIGVTGAYGVFLAAKENKELKFIEDACNYLNSARPTAVNLSWALNRMLQKAFYSKSNNIIENIYIFILNFEIFTILLYKLKLFFLSVLLKKIIFNVIL